ncbi:MAG TPA: peptidylprolyl isomerase [Kofleriaceae bacterium]|jgi:cyclophilin family peptidyl-prolyl cis-trans isomerase|nr:peptidylprolyl isomerase [Kofleriaceae bacterium]
MRASILFVAVAACGGGAGSVPDAGGGAADAATGDTVVVLATTMGDLVVQLYPDQMPVTTANFLRYVDDGWYDGTLVHRVIDDWVIQGGGYTTGLQAKTPYAPIPLETSAAVSHVDGAISMARTADPDSATSQWFIVDWPETGTPPQPEQLDGQYAAFGVLIEGFDVLAAITQVATTTSGSLDDVPVTEIAVTSAARR